MTSLRTSTIKGVKWTAISAAFLAITSPIYLFIKARFLTPEEFGYIAILLIITGLIKIFEGTGFTKGAILKDKVDIEESSSLFIFNLILTIIMAGVLYLFAKPIAIFFDFEGMDYYLQLLCVVVLLHGPTQFFRAFLEKFFLFKQIALTEITRQTLIISCTTVLLIQGWGVLGFIYGQLTGVLCASVLFVFWATKHKVTRLKLFFSFNKLRFFLRFGAFTSGRGLLNYLSKRIDEVVIGYFLGSELLGIYHFGKNILEQLRVLVNRSFSKILLPLFSRLKREQERLSEVYSKLTYYIAMASFPMFVGVAVTANLFVPVIFGQQWVDSVVVIQLFSIAFIFKMLTDGLAVNLLYSVNKPDTVLYWELLMSGIYIFALVIFAPIGLYAVITTYFLYTLIKSLAFQLLTHRHLTINIWKYFSLMKEAILFSLIMIMAVVGVQYVFSGYIDQSLLLVASIVVGVLVYLGLTLVFEKKGVQELYKLINVRKKAA